MGWNISFNFRRGNSIANDSTGPMYIDRSNKISFVKQTNLLFNEWGWCVSECTSHSPVGHRRERTGSGRTSAVFLLNFDPLAFSVVNQNNLLFNRWGRRVSANISHSPVGHRGERSGVVDKNQRNFFQEHDRTRRRKTNDKWRNIFFEFYPGKGKVSPHPKWIVIYVTTPVNDW